MICFKDYKIINIWIDSELTTYQIWWISGLGLRSSFFNWSLTKTTKSRPKLLARNLLNLITFQLRFNQKTTSRAPDEKSIQFDHLIDTKSPWWIGDTNVLFLNWLKKGKRHFRTMFCLMKFTSQAPGEKSIKLDDFSIRIQLENDLPSSRPEIYSIWPLDWYQKSPWWIGDTKVFFS